MNLFRLAAATALITLAGACGKNPPPVAAPPPAPAAPSAAQRYAALPDTVVCVVDRTTARGLRELPAKRENGSAVLLVDNEIRPLEQLHPVSVIAGYAGQETWYTQGKPITLQNRSYIKYAGERRVPIAQLKRLGEYQGIPLFGAPTDSVRPQAVYVPVRVGCIFNAYVREDLYKG